MPRSRRLLTSLTLSAAIAVAGLGTASTATAGEPASRTASARAATPIWRINDPYPTAQECRIAGRASGLTWTCNYMNGWWYLYLYW